ncbi:MAG: glycosyltransferase family 2 protein [Thermoanaerobaculia bacterium]
MKLSVVTSMYKSEAFVSEFHAAMSRVAGLITGDVEFIFVDDGSPDRSARIVEDLIRIDPRVRLLQFSRNFGHSPAMLAGMSKARGDLVFTADIDLEDPPDLLAQFHAIMTADPAIQSVYGFMSRRQGTFLERVTGKIFYTGMRMLSRDPIPHQTWSRLMTRQFLDSLLEYTEYHLFWSGLFHVVGFKQTGVPVVRTKTGVTSYSYAGKLSLAVSALTSFSAGPLYFIFLTGLLTCVISFLLAIFLIGMRLAGHLVPGWASIIVAVLLMGGLTNLSIGLIGFYVGRIFIQSKNRPRFFIAREL